MKMIIVKSGIVITLSFSSVTNFCETKDHIFLTYVSTAYNITPTGTNDCLLTN